MGLLSSCSSTSVRLDSPSPDLVVPELPHGDGIRLSVVIPTFNESHNITAVVAQLSQLLDAVMPHAYELIVVDDDSPDKTWCVAETLQPLYPNLRVVRRMQERGLSSAVVRGWQVARGEVLAVLDGDQQHTPDVLLKLLEALHPGIDLVVASRHSQGGGLSHWSLSRRIVSRGAQLLGLFLLPGILSRVSDPMSGYFLVRRQAIAGRLLHPRGYKILIEVLGRGSVRGVSEVGYVFLERAAGQSKATWKQAVEYLYHLIQLRLALWPTTRFLQFVVVGCFGVFVDTTLLFLFHDPSTLGWNLNLSKVIAAETTILHNFFWNDRWTFRDFSQQGPGRRNYLKRMVRFNLICLMGVGINLLLLNLLTRGFGLNYLIANFAAVGVVALWNFSLNWQLSKRKSPPPS